MPLLLTPVHLAVRVSTEHAAAVVPMFAATGPLARAARAEDWATLVQSSTRERATGAAIEEAAGVAAAEPSAPAAWKAGRAPNPPSECYYLGM